MKSPYLEIDFIVVHIQLIFIIQLEEFSTKILTFHKYLVKNLAKGMEILNKRAITLVTKVFAHKYAIFF